MRVLPALVGISMAMLACTNGGLPDPGQSGSEYEGPPVNMPPGPVNPGVPQPTHCPCTVLRDMQQLRATVTRVEDFPEVADRRYSLRVDAVLSPALDSAHELAVGDAFGGYWNGALPCAGMAAGPMAPGADVLAFYRRGLQDGVLCCERIACADDCPAELADDDGNNQSAPDPCEPLCEEQTEAACALHAEEAQMRGTVMLLPWGEELVVGENEFGTASIARSDLAALTLDQAACEAAIDDRSGALQPEPEPVEQPAAPAPQPAGSAAQPSVPPVSTMPPPSAPMGAPAMSPPPPVNPVMAADAPPAAHPEEVRVRCAD